VALGVVVLCAPVAAPEEPTGANGLRRPAAAGGIVTPKSDNERKSGSVNIELSSFIVRKLPSVVNISCDTGELSFDDKSGADEPEE
jgi:hypothetical protein